MKYDKKRIDLDNQTLPNILNKLYYHHIEVRIAATFETNLAAWVGAILRNNLMYAAKQIYVMENVSLQEQIDRCSLDENHPMYKDLIDGFPKGYLIALPDTYSNELRLDKGELLCFSIYLIGKMDTFYREFIQAIRLMCQRGIGHPMVPFTVVDICEKSLEGRIHLLSLGSDDLDDTLVYPISYWDYYTTYTHLKKTHIEINYITPVMLFKHTIKKDTSVSFQDKSNGFPSFYQLIRSTVARMVKLTILYINPAETDVSDLTMDALSDWIDYSTNLTLLAVDMQKKTLKNTPKKEVDNKMPLCGYVGNQEFEGDFNRYLPMLKFMEALGVGSETVYGMGRFRIKV